MFFFQAEDGIRDLVRSRGLGDVYKRQVDTTAIQGKNTIIWSPARRSEMDTITFPGPYKYVIYRSSGANCNTCLLYTSDAADERSSVDLGGRRIIKKKNKIYLRMQIISTTSILQITYST